MKKLSFLLKKPAMFNPEDCKTVIHKSEEDNWQGMVYARDEPVRTVKAHSISELLRKLR